VEALVKGIPFIILPIFINYLTKTEYGILSLYISILPLYAILFDLSQRTSIKKFYYEYPRQINEFVFSIFLSILLLSISIFSIMYIFNINFLSQNNSIFIFLNILLYAFIEQILVKYQISKDIKKYNIIYFLRNAMPYILGVLLLVTAQNKDSFSLIYAQTFIFLSLFLYISSILLKSINLISIKNNFIKYLRYSLSIAIPVLPVVISAYILSVSDRYMIEYFYGYNEVAEYSVAYTIAMIVQLFILAIGKAWQPFIFENLKNKNYNHIYKNAFYYMLVIALLSLFVYAIDKYLLLFLATPEYFNSLKLIPILLMGIYFFFLYSMVSNVVFFYKKMFLFGLPAMIAAITNVVLNYFLMPHYGYEIAAWTTLFSYAIEFIVISIIIIYLSKQINQGKI
jgi:O-antigen/teichoic acid export membrane protein